MGDGHGKIIACEIKPDETFAGIDFGGIDLGAASPHVHVTYEDGVTEDLFSYYTDELTFLENEFIGLTKREAQDLRLRRDVAYLRSE